MVNVATRKAVTAVGRGRNTGALRGAAKAGAQQSERKDPALAAALKQVNEVVQATFRTALPTKLTIVLHGPLHPVEIGTEPLFPETRSTVDLKAEQALLGALLFDNEGFDSLRPALTSEDFHEPFHQRLFAAMWERRQAGKLVEPIAIARRFENDPAYAEIGGLRYLADLVDRAPGVTEVPAYAARVGGLAIQRRAETHGDELGSALQDAQAQGAVRAADLLAGPEMLSADKFARLIGATRETVRQKLKRREVLGLQGAKRGIRYPAWQVSDEGGLLRGLPELFELFGNSPWAVYRFLDQPAAAFGGDRPKNRLRTGQVAQVLGLAEGQARGDFG